MRQLRYMLVPVSVLALSITSGCAGTDRPSEEGARAAYDELVTAARSSEGERMYFFLDTVLRRMTVADIQARVGMRDQFPSQQREVWDSLVGLEGKEAFLKLFSLQQEQLTEPFQGEYSVKNLGTYTVLEVEHKGKKPETIYLKWEEGEYRVSQGPEGRGLRPAARPVPRTPSRNGAVPSPDTENGGLPDTGSNRP